MMQFLAGGVFGWLAATLSCLGLWFTWALLQRLFPHRPWKQLGSGALLLVLGALPGVGLALLMLLMSVGVLTQSGPLAAGGFLCGSLATIAIAAASVLSTVPAPPPLPRPLGTFPSGHRFGPASKEETIHFGDPDPTFTMEDMRALEEEAQAEEQLAMMRDPRVVVQN